MLPLFQLPQGGWLDAVGAPGGVAHLVADGDAEPAKVGANQVDHSSLLALNVHCCPLASIFCPAVRPCRYLHQPKYFQHHLSGFCLFCWWISNNTLSENSICKDARNHESKHSHLYKQFLKRIHGWVLHFPCQFFFSALNVCFLFERLIRPYPILSIIVRQRKQSSTTRHKEKHCIWKGLRKFEN